MSKEFLINELENLGTALRVNRERVSNLVLDNPKLLPHLIEIVFEINNKLSIKAAWVLELVCEKHIDWLAPHLNELSLNIGKVYFGGAVRSLSKICNFLAIAYTSRTSNLIQIFLTESHIKAIIEVGFDWMISPHKVAVKAYSMNALYIFGKNSDWVHQELKLIIKQNIMKESAAYKARGKMTLALINKN